MDSPGEGDSSYSHQENEQESSSNDAHLTSRRDVLATLGAIGLGSAGLSLASCGSTEPTTASSPVATPTPTPSPAAPVADCVLAAELTQGPYYLDVDKLRVDITEGKPGVPLKVRITVLDVSNKNACKVVPNAAVEIWHCDASGHYSGFTAMSPDGGGGPGGPTGTPPAGGTPGQGGPMGTPPAGGTPGSGGPGSGTPGPGGSPPGGATKTDDQTFLRGTQLTDDKGVVEFLTIYPGWYAGRAIHIHTKVHVGGSVVDNAYQGGHTCHTGQFFFDEKVSAEVAKVPPYSERTTTRLPLSEDNIYPKNNTAGAMLKLTEQSPGNTTAGFLGTVAVGVDPNATPAAVGRTKKNR